MKIKSATPRLVFTGLLGVGFLARLSYALARTPVLALFAAYLGAGPEAVGFWVAISTITGIFFKMPAGVLADVIGRIRTLFLGLAFFAFTPLAYWFVSSYSALVVVRFFHGFATAIYGPVAMAVVVSLAGERRGEMLSWFSSLTIIGTLLGGPLGGFLLTYLSRGGAPSSSTSISSTGWWRPACDRLPDGLAPRRTLWQPLQGEGMDPFLGL